METANLDYSFVKRPRSFTQKIVQHLFLYTPKTDYSLFWAPRRTELTHIMSCWLGSLWLHLKSLICHLLALHFNLMLLSAAILRTMPKLLFLLWGARRDLWGAMSEDAREQPSRKCFKAHTPPHCSSVIWLDNADCCDFSQHHWSFIPEWRKITD